jgi:hypothetical protein
MGPHPYEKGISDREGEFQKAEGSVGKVQLLEHGIPGREEVVQGPAIGILQAGFEGGGKLREAEKKDQKGKSSPFKGRKEEGQISLELLQSDKL